MNKVYCKECRFCGYLHIDCKATFEIEGNYAGKWKKRESCRDRNMDNECKMYKRKWWKFWVK